MLWSDFFFFFLLCFIMVSTFLWSPDDSSRSKIQMLGSETGCDGWILAPHQRAGINLIFSLSFLEQLIISNLSTHLFLKWIVLYQKRSFFFFFLFFFQVYNCFTRFVLFVNRQHFSSFCCPWNLWFFFPLLYLLKAPFPS